MMDGNLKVQTYQLLNVVVIENIILGIDFIGGYNTIGSGDTITRKLILPSHTLLKI